MWTYSKSNRIQKDSVGSVFAYLTMGGKVKNNAFTLRNVVLAKRFYFERPEQPRQRCKIKEEEGQITEIPPHHHLLRMDAVSLCHMESKYHQALVPPEKMKRYPVVPGHEGSGTIVASNGTFQEGTRVSVISFQHCSTCASCLEGRTNYCLEGKLVGSRAPGLLQTYLVYPESFLVPVQENVSPFLAALAEPSAAAYRALQTFSPQGRVAVYGSSSLGYLLVAHLSYFGKIPKEQLCFFGRSPSKLEMAQDIAETIFIDEESRRKYAGSFDYVFEAVGAPESLQNSLDLTRPGGKLIILGTKDNLVTLCAGSEKRDISNVTNFVNSGGSLEVGGKSVRSSSVSLPEDYGQVTKAMVDPRYRALLQRMISPERFFRIRGPEEVRAAFEYREKNPHIKKVFLTFGEIDDLLGMEHNHDL